MAKYQATIHTALDQQRAFALMADFANAEAWDPATVSSRKLSDGPIGRGTRFVLEMKILGRENSIEYEIVEYDPPRRIKLRGENAGSVSIDEVTVNAAGDGADVTYEAVVTMKHVFKVIGPFFGPVFKRMGDDARDRIGPWLDSHATDGSA